jgi:hypothetical protein
MQKVISDVVDVVGAALGRARRLIAEGQSLDVQGT